MRNESGWQPVMPSHYLRAAENIVAGFLGDTELALWRSAEGTAQAWENRCPHRGTRLTLGRILDGRLSCAYHGWEFSADSGRCSAIPAQPSSPAPKNLAVARFPVREEGGMVWVRTGAPAEDDNALQCETAAFFCRSMGVNASEAQVAEALLGKQFERVAPSVWKGKLAAHACTLFLNAAGPSLTFVHAWLAERPQQGELRKIMAALAQLRESAGQSQTTRSHA